MQFSLEEDMQGMINYFTGFLKKATINYPGRAEKMKNTAEKQYEKIHLNIRRKI